MGNEPVTKPRLLTGRCLCGSVEYRVEDAFRYAMNCHCSNCRRATGSAFKPFAGIGRERLRITKGDDALLIYGDPPDNHDIHCGRCGSLLFSSLKQQTIAHVTLGSLVDPPSIRPSTHMFVGSRAPWHVIADDLPQFDEFPE